MAAITTIRLTVDAEGRVSSSERLPAGEYVVRVEAAGQPGRQRATEPFDVAKLPKLDLGPWPWADDETFRREDMYGDDGR